MNFSKVSEKKQSQKTEYEIWKNIFPKNNNIKETFKLIKFELQEIIQINQYTLNKKDLLGKGFYGEVFKVKNISDNQYYTCKIFNRSTFPNTVFLNNQDVKIEEFIKKELTAAKLIKNENLTIAHEIIDDIKADSIYLIMELCQGEFVKFDSKLVKFDNKYFHNQCLNNIIFTKKQIDYDKLKKVFKQLILGLQQLHNLNLAHCDIKPQNIMNKKGNAKIADFGSLAQTDPSDHHQSTIDNGFGTPYFLAPCTTQTHDKSKLDKFKLDIWALGITFFIYSFGFLPFDIRFEKGALLPKNQSIRWQIIDEYQQYTNELKDFIIQMLINDPILRPNIYELAEHDYLNDEKDQQNLCIQSFNSEVNSIKSSDLTTLFFTMYGLNGHDMVLESTSISEQNSDNDLIKSVINNPFQGTEKAIHKKKTINKKISHQKSQKNNLNSQSLESENILNYDEFEIKQSINLELYRNKNFKFNSSLKSLNNNSSLKNTYLDSPKVKNSKFSKFKLLNSNKFDSKSQFKNNSSIDNGKCKNEFKQDSLPILYNNKQKQDSIIKYGLNTQSTNMFESDSNSSIQKSKLSRQKETKQSLSSINSTRINDNQINQMNTETNNSNNDQDLFSMIYDSINHKHRYQQYDQNIVFRRQSDSNMLDVIELRNNLNIKDIIIYDCLKMIDQVEKQVK